jgi:hypothetical protein
VVETAGRLYLYLAACSVVLAFTVVVNAVSHWSDSTDKTEEGSMENKLVHLKMVRSSVLSTIKDIGTAAIGGLLAA